MTIEDVDERDQVDNPDDTQYDVFLSYKSADRAVVQNVARRLREAGVRVWFDVESITPGGDWQDELSARLLDCRACAIFVGAQEIGGWAGFESKVVLNRAANDREFRFFAVLLPAAGPDFDLSRLPPFLATRHSVDLREGPESEEAIQELVNAIDGVAPSVPAAAADDRECPYRGLAAFEEGDARYFFGRTTEVRQLVDDLRQARFVAVIGQSGVGKSSLVQAGLLPALRSGALPGSETWRFVVTRPGADPTASLATTLLALAPGRSMQETVDGLVSDERTLHLAAALAMAEEPAGSKLLVVLDQFEEIFTLCTDPDVRSAFVRNVVRAATVPHGPTVVVATMRGDFYPQVAQFPALADLARNHRLVPRLTDDQLRLVIQEPAYRAGLQVEQGLTDTILADVERKPGNLPLLQHALLETWRKKRGTMLTLAGYRATGGVRHGLSERAETAFTALSEAGRARAKHVFLRLIQPGEGTEDTRRRVSVTELTTDDEDSAVAEVIRQFVEARLLTTSTDEGGERWVEISHEAVITGWAKCAKWVAEDRAGLLVHRRLTLAAQEWQRLDRSTDALYRGRPLAEATAWRADADDRLNSLEREFLDAGSALERAERDARLAQERAERDARRAQERAARVARRRWIVAACAGVVIILVAGVVVVAGMQMRTRATSRQLAFQASSVLDVDPALSLALALRAMDVAPTEMADQVLRQATATSQGRWVSPAPGGAVYSVRLLPDGRAVTGSLDGVVRIWTLGVDQPAREFALHKGGISAVRVGPGGQSVASAGADRTVRLTDVATGQSRLLLTAPAKVQSIEFNHRGDLLAVALGDGTAHVVDFPSGRTVAVLATGTSDAYAASFSADDTLLATANLDGSVQVFAPTEPVARQVLPRFGTVESVHFGPVDHRLAVAGHDGKVRIWDGDTAALVQELDVSRAPLFFVRFSPDGTRLATGGRDGNIHLQTAQGRAEATLRGHNGNVHDVDFEQTGPVVVSAGIDGTIRTWVREDDVHVPGPVTLAHFDRDATRIVAGGPDGRLRLWRRSDLTTPVLDLPDHVGYSRAGFSTDGSQILSYGVDGAVTTRDVQSGKELTSFRPDVGVITAVTPDPEDRRLLVGGDNGRLILVNHDGVELEELDDRGSPVYTARFSPDGQSVLAGRLDGSVTRWGPDRRPVTIKPVDHEPVYDVAFSPNGSVIATADASGSVNLWNTLDGSIAPLRGHNGLASAVRFRGDGRQLFSSGADGTVRVWDVASRHLLMTFAEGDGAVADLDVSPDGATILQSSESGRARLLSCQVCGPVESVVALAGSRKLRTLTPEEERRFSLTD